MKKYWHWLAVAGFMGMILMPKAHAVVCATKVQILSIYLDGMPFYHKKASGWAAEYKNTDGTTKWIMSDVFFDDNPAAPSYLNVIRDVIKSRELVTLERKSQASCSDSYGTWFDTITTGR